MESYRASPDTTIREHRSSGTRTLTCAEQGWSDDKDRGGGGGRDKKGRTSPKRASSVGAQGENVSTVEDARFKVTRRSPHTLQGAHIGNVQM